MNIFFTRRRPADGRVWPRLAFSLLPLYQAEKTRGFVYLQGSSELDPVLQDAVRKTEGMGFKKQATKLRNKPTAFWEECVALLESF